MARPSDPPFAYVPGQTARHSEGAFDAIRDTAQSGMDEAALAGSDAFQTGLRYLRDGFYWEAHEVLEPVWMLCPPNTPARAMVQGLIQLANARLKEKMGKPGAAARLYAIARAHLAEGPRDEVMGIRKADMIAEIDSARQGKGVLQYNAHIGLNLKIFL